MDSEEFLEALLSEENVEIGRRFELSKIQDAWSWRNVHEAHQLALHLLDEKGEIKKKALLAAEELLKKNLYSPGPDRQHDDRRREHLLKILNHLIHDPEYMLALKRIVAPEGHAGALNLIRETLHLPENARVTSAHARLAALSALLTTLRQNVGSCFATAPAILVQQQRPLQFLDDMQQILATGRLKRTFDGVEYAFPLSPSWGAGDLLRPLNIVTLGEDPLALLALSPGLQAAFRAAGLTDTCEVLLKRSGLEEELTTHLLIISPEQLIQRVLLDAYGLHPSDLKRYQEQDHMSMPLAFSVVQPQSTKTRVVEGFLKAFQRGKKAFKRLTDHPLLKSWEFTIASLSESKADFTKWNLYISLGVQVEERYGIGEALSGLIQQEIDEINDEIKEYESRYDHLYAQAKSLEGRILRSGADKELEWIRLEYQMRRRELDRTLSEWDNAYDKGRRLSGLYNFLLQFYGERIPHYFQEIYDPEMHEISTNPYDDSPAGFRLLYKHGRSNPSLWTLIYSASEYVQALASFFVATETELAHDPHVEGLERELARLITAALTTIKRPEFLESSVRRLEQAYHQKRTPWAYISGGTVRTLINCYWGNPRIQEEKKWVESPQELMAFFIDTIKELPSVQRGLFEEDKERALLAFSPTHAFLVKPGWTEFKRAWQSDVYTYTWIRDEWLLPQQKFLDATLLDQWMIERLMGELVTIFPLGYREMVRKVTARLPDVLHPVEFRERVLRELSYERWSVGYVQLVGDEIDGLLYKLVPFFHERELREKWDLLLIGAADEEKHRVFSAQDVRNRVRGCMGGRSGECVYGKLVERMREVGLMWPAPFLFGDTNWVKNSFGFVLNPGTGKVDLWRLDDLGVEGRPMSAWRGYMDGSQRLEWGLFNVRI